VTAAGSRKIALRLPETAESSHFHVPDFRVAGKIFARLGYEKEGCGVLLLTPHQQAGMITGRPGSVLSRPRRLGRQGFGAGAPGRRRSRYFGSGSSSYMAQ